MTGILALYIIGGIILFILALLLIPVTVTLEYDEKFSGKVRYLFISRDLTEQKKKPKKKREKKRTNPKKAEKKKESSLSKNLKIIKESYKLKGFEGVKKILRIAVYLVKKLTKLIKRHLVVSELLVTLKVGGEDAADTALKYGKFCAFVFPLLTFLTTELKVRKYNADVSPDFLSLDNKAYIYAKMKIKPLFILASAISILFKIIIKPLISRKIKNKTNDKAVLKNERK